MSTEWQSRHESIRLVNDQWSSLLRLPSKPSNASSPSTLAPPPHLYQAGQDFCRHLTPPLSIRRAVAIQVAAKCEQCGEVGLHLDVGSAAAAIHQQHGERAYQVVLW